MRGQERNSKCPSQETSFHVPASHLVCGTPLLSYPLYPCRSLPGTSRPFSLFWYILTVLLERGGTSWHTHTKKDKQDKCHHKQCVVCTYTQMRRGCWQAGTLCPHKDSEILFPMTHFKWLVCAMSCRLLHAQICKILAACVCMIITYAWSTMVFHVVVSACCCWTAGMFLLLSVAGICKGTIMHRSINSRHITLSWEEIFLHSLLATDYSLRCLMHCALTSLNWESVVYVYPSVIKKKLNWWIRVESLLVMNITKFRMSTWIMCHWKNSLSTTLLQRIRTCVTPTEINFASNVCNIASVVSTPADWHSTHSITYRYIWS